MEQDKPKISVIVPVYNVEAFVEKCLVSLAVQTYPNMEVIMVDDASTDSGGDICDDFAARDSRFWLCIFRRTVDFPLPGIKESVRHPENILLL